MIFTDIRLQNFRSYTDSSFELGKGVTIIIGPNAAGKTNLLEAVMLAAIGKTYRPKESLIKSGEVWARIDIHTSLNSMRSIKLLKSTQKPESQIEIDGKKYRKLAFKDRQPVVLFEPDDLSIISGEPQKRRDYLDTLLEQLSEGFSKTRGSYKRALFQRNRLLKQKNKDPSLFFAWDLRLVEDASEIINKRLELIKQLNKKLANIYSEIAAEKFQAKIVYEPTAETKNYSASLLKELEQNLERDQNRGFTSSGPHRDRVVLRLDGEEVGSTGSRGETRTLLLALKIMELKLIEKKLEKKPIFLLDDVFSELDGARRKSLVGFIKNYQTIITTTDADIVTKNFSQKCQIIPL